MKKIIFCALLLFAAFLCGTQPVSALSWVYDYDSALSTALATGKPVMIDFYTDWCGWCKKLDLETYQDSKVQALSSNFICLKIDGDKHGDLAKKYGVRGYPNIIFLSSKGNVIERVNGFAEAEVFRGFMERAIAKNDASLNGADNIKDKIISIFAPKKKLETVENKQKPAVKNPVQENSKFKLTEIIFDPKNPKAVINNAEVKPGESIDGAQVSQITQNTVILLYQGESVILVISK